MGVHAKLTPKAITLLRNTSRFLFFHFAILYSQLKAFLSSIEPLGSSSRLFRFPRLRVMHFRSQRVRAHSKLRSIQDLETHAKWPSKPQFKTREIDNVGILSTPAAFCGPRTQSRT